MTRTIVGAAVLASVLGPAAAVTLEAQAIREAINPTMDARCAAFPEGGRHRVWCPGRSWIPHVRRARRLEECRSRATLSSTSRTAAGPHASGRTRVAEA